MSFYLIRPDETEEPTWVAVEYPASSMSVYVWVPALGRFVYSPEMSSEFGYSLRETLFDRIIRSGTLTIESAGDSADELLRNIPRSDEIQQLINRLIDEDARRRSGQA